MYPALLTFVEAIRKSLFQIDTGKLRQRWSRKEVMAWTAIQAGQTTYHFSRNGRLTFTEYIQGYHACASGRINGQVAGLRRVFPV